MKIYVLDTQTKKPLTNYKFQLQVRGADSGFLSLSTDTKGCIELDKKYLGQQIAASFAGGQGQWITAADGISLYIDNAKAVDTAKSTQSDVKGMKTESFDKDDVYGSKSDNIKDRVEEESHH